MGQIYRWDRSTLWDRSIDGTDLPYRVMLLRLECIQGIEYAIPGTVD